MTDIGYSRLHALVGPSLLPPAKPAVVSPAVNRRVDEATRTLFPPGVAIEDSLLGHVEFALRHEPMNLALLKAALGAVSGGELAERYRHSPNGEYLRRACTLWEWFHGMPLDPGARTAAAYVDLLDPEQYLAAGAPERNATFRVANNLLGNTDFCPIVRRSDAIAGAVSIDALIRELDETFRELGNDPVLYERAISYLFLEETRKSFRIEHENPTGSKEEAFVGLLKHVGERKAINEDWLVTLQNLAVRDDFSREASFRTGQNFLSDSANRVTFFPPAPAHLRALMNGWMRFANDRERTMDPIAKAACVSFGFVFLHPFMDGNGRVHRFLLHHALASHLPADKVIPVSAVLHRHLDRYSAALRAFSGPITQLWEYQRATDEPMVTREPGPSPYAFWDATAIVELTHWALETAVREEVPQEIRYLATYDTIFERVSAERDIPSKDLSVLVRSAIQSGGKLSSHRRKQFFQYPETVFERIEVITGEELARLGDQPLAPRRS